MDLALVAIFIGCAAFVLDLLSLALPYWVVWGEINFGLWQYCGNVCVSMSSGSGYLDATRAFELIGFLGGVAVMACMVLYVLVPQTKGNNIIGILAKVGCFVVGGLLILGVIIFGAKNTTGLHVAFAFAIMAALAYFLAGVVLFVSRRNQPVVN